MAAEKLLIIAAFHYDVAYRNTFEGYLPASFKAIDQGLELLAEFPQYVFCIEQVILLDVYWQRRPEQWEKLRQFAEEKRLIFCPGVWSMPDANLPNAESFYQNVIIGRKWLQEHLDAVPGPICWMADVFGHHAQSPQIYSQCGYDLYMFERGQLESEKATDFIWRGIDGTDMLTHWEQDTYYGLNLGLGWNRPFDWIYKRVQQEVVQQQENDGRSSIFSVIGGDFLAPERRHIDCVQRWNSEHRHPEIEWAHPDRYVDSLKTDRNKLKVLEADFNPLLQGVYSSRIRLKQLNREAEALIYALEALVFVQAEPAQTEHLWKKILKQQFHDIICGSLNDCAWKEALTESVALKEDLGTEIENRFGAGKETILYNPLPYGRKFVVETPARFVQVQVDGLEIARLADVTLKVQDPVQVEPETRTLENSQLSASFDEYGRLLKLVDKENCITYEDKRHGFLHDVACDPDCGDPWILHNAPINPSLLHATPYHDPIRPSATEITRRGNVARKAVDGICGDPADFYGKAETDGCRAALVAKRFDGVVITYELWSGEKMLRITTEFQHIGARNRVRAVMPTGIRDGRIRREIPAGFVAQPEGEYPTQNWIDFADNEKGLCLLNRGLPGNNVTDGVLLLTLFRSVPLFEPDIIPDYESDVAQKAQYALYPFQPEKGSYHPTRLGREFNSPVISTQGDVGKACRSLLSLETQNCELLSLRRLDNETFEIRLHESEGQNTTAILYSRLPVTQIREVTPFGKVVAVTDADPVQQYYKIKLRPFEIKTLHLTAAALRT